MNLNQDKIDFLNNLSWKASLWLDAFKPEIRKQLEKKLFNSREDLKQLEEIENEISIGYLLVKSGFDVLYEKEIDGKTPDWYVCGNNIHSDIIVEVKTLNSKDVVVKFREQLEILIEKIQTLPFGVILELGCLHVIDEKMVTSFFDLDITFSELKEWLLSDPQIDNRIEIKDLVFTVTDKNDSDRVLVAKSLNLGHQASYYRFIESIKEKGNKYKNIVSTNKLPYIIAIFNKLESGVDPYYIENLFERGHLKWIDILDVNGIVVIEQLPNWSIDYISNPYQHYKLDESIFDSMLSFHGIPIDKVDDFRQGRYKLPSIDDLFS